MDNIHLDIDMRQINAGLTRMMQSIPGGEKLAMSRTVLSTEGKAKEYCPFDEGRLEASIAGEVDEDGSGIVHTSNVEYAADQHENLEYQHPKKGQAKFIEIAVAEVGSEEFLGNVATYVMGEMAK